MIIKEFGYFVYPKNHNVVRIIGDEKGYDFLFNNLSKDNKRIKQSNGRKIVKNYSYEDMISFVNKMKLYSICEHYEGEWINEKEK